MNPAALPLQPPPSFEPSLSRPPPPPAGSPRYFALLYSPAASRAMLTTLLALADEISAGAGRALEHSVAHARLDWWRAEAERYQQGQPQHPWLRALQSLAPSQARLDLQPLVDAAAIDLATASFGAQSGLAPDGPSLPGAVFGQFERALRTPAAAAPPPQLLLAVRDLGRLAGELERLAGAPAPLTQAGASAAALVLDALRPQLAAIERPLQARLAPLLVWLALIARRARRRLQRPAAHGSSALDALADNMVAWNAARRAARGRFRIDRA